MSDPEPTMRADTNVVEEEEAEEGEGEGESLGPEEEAEMVVERPEVVAAPVRSYADALNQLQTPDDKIKWVQGVLASFNVYLEMSGKSTEESVDVAELLAGSAFADLFSEKVLTGVGPLRDSPGHNLFQGPSYGGFGLIVAVSDSSVKTFFGKKSPARHGTKSYTIHETFEVVLDSTLAEPGSARNCVLAHLHSYFLLVRFEPGTTVVVQVALVGVFDACWMVTVQVLVTV
jgi:hypothetical protein